MAASGAYRPGANRSEGSVTLTQVIEPADRPHYIVRSFRCEPMADKFVIVGDRADEIVIERNDPTAHVKNGSPARSATACIPRERGGDVSSKMPEAIHFVRVS